MIDLYIFSENQPMTLSNKLTKKSLCPNSFEEQKVSLALKILCQENVESLKYITDLQKNMSIDKFLSY